MVNAKPVIFHALFVMCSDEIDTSWMPYDLNKEKRQPNIQKVIKNLRKMSISSMRSSKSVLSGSMYSIVKKAVNNQKYLHMYLSTYSYEFLTGTIN